MSEDDGWRPSGRPFGRPRERGSRPWAGENIEFFAAMGWAFTRWNSVEFALANYFGRLTTTRQSGVGYKPYPEAAMSTVNSFRTRVEMTDAVAKMMLPKEHYSAWTHIRQRIIDANTRRNRLAHWHLVGKIDSLEIELRELHYLAPKRRTPDSIDSTMMLNWGYDFLDLASDIADLRPWLSRSQQ